jgi:hypothetical protein
MFTAGISGSLAVMAARAYAFRIRWQPHHRHVIKKRLCNMSDLVTCCSSAMGNAVA